MSTTTGPGARNSSGGEALGTLEKEEVAALRKHVTAEQFRQDVLRYSSLRSRHVDHPDNALAVEMLLEDLLETGRALTVGTHAFRIQRRVMHNVEAVLPGEPSDRIVVVSAHLDCTAHGEPGYQPRSDGSPGADDDASGIAGVLAVARALVKLAGKDRRETGEARPEKPHREIRFVLFNAEEHRRKGSRRYAREKRHATIEAVLHMDMIGHHPGLGRPAFELHTGYSGGPTDSWKLARLIESMAGAVSPNLEAQIYPLEDGGDDPSDNLSDHTSFHELNIPACLISEDFFDEHGTGTSCRRNPDYHLREDTIENIDPEYGADIARAVAAAAWYLATR